jgi:2-isopropylmalate synthase
MTSPQPEDNRVKGMDPAKYRPYMERFPLPDGFRPTWMEQQVLQAPAMASVCLRDGNQALNPPMTLAKKMRYYQMLLDIGFKEIEIGYPVSGAPDLRFTRTLIDEYLIPEGVRPQVLVLAHEKMIKDTIDALRGAPETIVHVYNSTSKVHRETVLKVTTDEVLQKAVRATADVRRYALEYDVPVQYQYSPESFTGTELDFALDVCNAVIREWEPTPDNKMILNLPATLEICEPDLYAARVEYICRNLYNRENVIVSVHTHNDRGSAEVAARFAIRGGADRVEGSLFGLGERSGNMDLSIFALNLLTQGVDPMHDFGNMPAIKDVWEECTGLRVPSQHPYAGANAFMQRSGTHQSAHTAYEARSNREFFEHPYMGIDPVDIGRDVERVVEVTSQSGKKGYAKVLRDECLMPIPERMEVEVYNELQPRCEAVEGVFTAEQLQKSFYDVFVAPSEPCIRLKSVETETKHGQTLVRLEAFVGEQACILQGSGNGPIAATTDALRHHGYEIEVSSLTEDALSPGAQADAIAFVSVVSQDKCRFGVGIDASIELAGIRALITAVNRSLK